MVPTGHRASAPPTVARSRRDADAVARLTSPTALTTLGAAAVLVGSGDADPALEGALAEAGADARAAAVLLGADDTRAALGPGAATEVAAEAGPRAVLLLGAGRAGCAPRARRTGEAGLVERRAVVLLAPAPSDEEDRGEEPAPGETRHHQAITSARRSPASLSAQPLVEGKVAALVERTGGVDVRAAEADAHQEAAGRDAVAVGAALGGEIQARPHRPAGG